MTSINAIPWTISLLLLLAGPTLAQHGPSRDGGLPPEAVERLERIRLERLQRALQLTEEEMEALRSRMRAHRGDMRDAMGEQREAIERLHAALRADPVDQQEVARAMQAVERRREAMRALHDRHREVIGRDLSPEKRAKLMLFNEQFDRHLRELVSRHRASRAGLPTPGREPTARGPGALPYRPGMAPPRGPAEALDPSAIRQRIGELEAELDRLRDRLEETEG